MTLPITRRRTLAMAGAAVLVPLAAPRLGRAAALHEVQMLNVHPDNPRQRMVFLPRVLVIQPGDTVTFLATDGGHNSAIIDGMIPEGAEGWNGRINEEVSVTPEVPGFYGYQCTPHYAMGMVGLIVVEGDGMMDNYEAVREVRQRGRAAQAFDEIWAEVEGMDLVN